MGSRLRGNDGWLSLGSRLRGNDGWFTLGSCLSVAICRQPTCACCLAEICRSGTDRPTGLALRGSHGAFRLQVAQRKRSLLAGGLFGAHVGRFRSSLGRGRCCGRLLCSGDLLAESLGGVISFVRFSLGLLQSGLGFIQFGLCVRDRGLSLSCGVLGG